MAYYNPYQNQYYTQQLAQAYTPVQVPQQNVTPVQQNNNGLIWVQGETGAKSYLVAPNTTVMLMDSESQRFFLKSSDASGMPQPLRIFEYHETTQNALKTPPAEQTVDYSSFATKAEFEAFRNEIDGILKNISKEMKDNGKFSVQRAESKPEG